MDEFQDIKKEIKKYAIKAIQRKINECLENDMTEGLVTIALGDTFIQRCVNSKVNKDVFLQQMSLAWDHHIQGD